MRLYNDVILESQLVYGDYTEHLNVNSIYGEIMDLRISNGKSKVSVEPSSGREDIVLQVL